MKAGTPPGSVGQAERKVASLKASGYPEAILHRAVASTLDQNLPLRDAIVLREAKRLADQRTPRAAAAWTAVLDWLRPRVPESTIGLWIEPLSVVGEQQTTLILTGPDGIRAWAERRYSSLISKALREPDSTRSPS